MQTFFKEFVILINIIYWLPMFICFAITLVVAWLLSSHFKIKKIYKIIISLITACAVSLFWIIPAEKAERQRIAKYNERKEKYQVAKAVFDEQCKKAGEKIYRTVDNVDGIMLLKVRKSKHLHENDPMFEDVLSVLEDGGEDGYINSFLSSKTAAKAVGYMPPMKEQGYLFVDVLEETGDITRYVDYIGRGDDDKYKYTTTKNPANTARYAITYENNVDPELRKHWVAGTTIKIIDRQTDELLAEKTIFAFARTMGNYVHGAWVDSRMGFCPEVVEQRATKHFVVTVLKP